MHALVFGANGTLGGAIVDLMKSTGIQVVTASRNSSSTDIQIEKGDMQLKNLGYKFDSCIWAQGVNTSDTLVDSEDFQKVFDANVGFIIATLKTLLKNDLLSMNARLVVVSSIWQEASKSKKFSYTVSKSALKGLVNSFIADYSSQGLSMNAVLPGVVDTPMTRANLDHTQISNIEKETPTKTLVTSEEVAKAVNWLASSQSSGINGQFIRVDNGWSQIRAI
jgi:3-oxoacyl-[acyl-carrier protein] reductase